VVDSALACHAHGMAELKTKPNDDDVDAFIDSVPEAASGKDT
jgi:hypothetical protein